MGHLGSRGWCSIVEFNHSIMELRGHGNNHVIKIWIEISSLRDIEPKWWVVVVASEQVVGVVDQARLVSTDLGELRWPGSVIRVLCLVDGHVGSPHSIVNHSLSVVPFLEEITFVLLMSRVDPWSVNHFVHKFSLFETLVNK